MNRTVNYPRVEPNVEDWEIYKLTADKKAFADLFIEKSLEQIYTAYPDPKVLEEKLVKAVYLENIRLKKRGWRVDTNEEKEFWGNLKVNLDNYLKEGEAKKKELYRSVVSLYAHEILGNFNAKTHRFAETATAVGFNRLFNPARIIGKYDAQDRVSKRIHTMGKVDAVRTLSTKGTIVLLPTHHSNLDSILLGWAINYVGLPAFLYGAGLNLFNNSIMGYYMNRLGAYKIDRRKKNAFYLETLKTYSKLTIQRGCHTLFFPGGTRSRSGKLEERLKLGLLSTVVDAQQLNYTKPISNEKANEKIFIVPLVISYHFVLEAAQLIEQHLKQQGKEKYFSGEDSVPSTTKFINFFTKLMTNGSNVALNFGKPMDILGNDVDEETGISYDQNGKEVDIKQYFMNGGQLTHDNQRTSEYTRMLADKIVERYKSENVILTSHFCSYLAFQILKKRHKTLDLYGLLRLSKEDSVIPFDHFIKVAKDLKEKMLVMHQENKLTLSPYILEQEVEQFVKYGLSNTGIYHSKKVLFQNKKGDISSEDLKLLYFYHNRMSGYGLSSQF